MLAKIKSGVIIGLETYGVEIEVEHRNGYPGFEIVGLPDTAIKEAKDRIFQAIRHSEMDLRFRRILCNLAPADLKKSGTYLDLPIALGILSSSGFFENELFEDFFIAGELSFSGEVRAVKGALPLAIHVKKTGIRKMILPRENFQEVCVIDKIDYYPVENLKEALEALQGQRVPEKLDFHFTQDREFEYDYTEVKGQALAKRGIEIAAAGFHNFLLIGSPGVGKSMLIKRLPSILPPLTLDEAIEISSIYSVSSHKETALGLISERPFRSPHHTASEVSIVGGGSIPKAGEITLAHRGVLFLDELPEFKRAVFETLREPLEEKKITITRSERTQTFPASFLLAAAMNPCPCGFAFHPVKTCECSPSLVKKYYQKISGPILDRIDIQIQVSEVSYKEIERKEESSAEIRKRVLKARNIQSERLGEGRYNSDMTSKEIEKFCHLKQSSKSLLKKAIEKNGISMRAYTRILKTARTIADLEEKKEIEDTHLLEAFQYRSLEKNIMLSGARQ